MELYVSDEIKLCVSKCCNSFECLTWQKDKFCKVTSMVNDNMLYVHCQYGKECNYQHTVDERTLCTCPVRLEVFKKYNI